MNASQKVTRIILAAGAGRRMGGNKALLDLNGMSALERIARLSLPDHDLQTIVVCGAESNAVASKANSLGLDTIVNADWEAGQTGSLTCALRGAPDSSSYLLHPVDLPLIVQDDYDRLGRAMSEEPGHRIYVTSIDMRRGHPLVFDRVFADEILNLAADASLRRLTRACEDVVHVEVMNPWVRRDLDTPADLESARRQLAGSGPSVSP